MGCPLVRNRTERYWRTVGEGMVLVSDWWFVVYGNCAGFSDWFCVAGIVMRYSARCGWCSVVLDGATQVRGYMLRFVGMWGHAVWCFLVHD